MVIVPATGVVLALTSAIAWGGADFTGGLASRRSNHLEVLALSRLALLVLVAAVAAVLRDPLPPVASAGWAAAAGMSGALGIAALYKGLATERAALVVPTSGVVGAAIPVLYGAVVVGVLPIVQQAGLVTALVGIWLVSEGHRSADLGASQGLAAGALAGLGFGGFFILLGQVDSGPVFTPLAAAGCGGFSVAVVALVVSRARLPSPPRNPPALLAGVLDGTGLVFYMLAMRWIRLDVAAVLGSLHPAVTVLLFRAISKEQVTGTQWIGLTVCVVAIALIAV